MNRRHLLALSAAATAVPAFSTRASEKSALALKKGAVILFQGDSITDAHRDRKVEDKANDPAMFGRGYPFHLGGQILADHPKQEYVIYNRGISGNKVPDLAARWQKDCLDLKPDLISILIGINDLWHKLGGRYDGTPELYREGFTQLLDETKKALPTTTLVICEPFVLRCGAVDDSWFPEFETRRNIAAEVAQTVGAIWVPFHQTFEAAVKSGTEPAYWAADGVHPTQAGHALMAKVWREKVGL